MLLNNYTTLSWWYEFEKCHANELCVLFAVFVVRNTIFNSVCRSCVRSILTILSYCRYEHCINREFSVGSQDHHVLTYQLLKCWFSFVEQEKLFRISKTFWRPFYWLAFKKGFVMWNYIRHLHDMWYVVLRNKHINELLYINRNHS